jgi:hypothetical protein
MEFPNHMGLVREAAIQRDLRPGYRTILRTDEGAVETLDAKQTFGR